MAHRPKEIWSNYNNIKIWKNELIFLWLDGKFRYVEKGKNKQYNMWFFPLQNIGYISVLEHTHYSYRKGILIFCISIVQSLKYGLYVSVKMTKIDLYGFSI